MEKREWLKEKQLLIYARTGYWVTQSSLDEVYMSDDKIILEQIEALKELRELYPKLTKEINSDLHELLTNPNATRIKLYNEQYATNMRNDIETQMVKILYWLSILENSGFTDKQRELLLNIVEGYSYEGRHKDYNFLLKKLERAKKERNNKMDNDKKRQFSEEQLAKLFPNFYSNPNTYYDEHLNFSRKLSCYSESVAESKRKGDYYRSLSLKYSIYPIELNTDEQMQEGH